VRSDQRGDPRRGDPSGAADRRRRLRRAEAKRRAVARRRALLLAGVVLVVAVPVALLLGTGSGARARRRTASAPAESARALARAREHRAASLEAYERSPELRRLIALGRPVYCAGRRGDEVALTFDDGPGPYTRLMLHKLRGHGVAATFFVVGRNIGLVPGATRAERAIGAVGDHTFTHPLLTALAPAEATREIVRTKLALERSSGGPVVLFRPPYGARNATIDAIARTHGLLETLWTVDSADSLGANYAQIERNVIAGMRPGAIILMHENHGQTVRAMLTIFAALTRRHLRAVSVPQLLTDDPPAPAQVQAGWTGCGLRAGAAPAGD
jgi:peptidoglycan/xylan/chitin deacetylase (PgdA/CDA1 family)